MTESTERRRKAWTLAALHAHFQGAIELELWTIPYYLTVLYSIKDPTSEPYRLIQAAVYQEMLHTQLVANIANAYGYSPRLSPPEYAGQRIPHLDFRLDARNPTEQYSPYSAELGPLDACRVNTMCLVEYPEWRTEREPDLAASRREYGSIGEFYDAVRVGMGELRRHVRASQRQVDEFSSFYQGHPGLTVTEPGDRGFRQALSLIDVIVDQGEGQTQPIETVPTESRNTADGYKDAWPHFHRFEHIRKMTALPAVYAGTPNPPAGSAGLRMQQLLAADFSQFLAVLNRAFAGEPMPAGFGVQMARLGGEIVQCWQHGAIPRFS